ncbi:histone acetyltransferase HAC12 [Morus notabilis]|uniref:histone acetyltransferase HAC12 n=1 Tax=Morus notabilis TaxID=981085 RepID=UPI000CED63E9|nr:histone acetyltransferase HAC12 [Morus notabilis]
MPEQNSSEFDELEFRNLPHLYQPDGNGSRNWPRDPAVSRHRDSVRRKIADFLSVKTSYGMQQREFLVTSLEVDLFMQASSKEEYANPETLNDRLEFLLQCKHNAAEGQDKNATFIILDPPSPSGMEMATSETPHQPLVHNRLDGNSTRMLSLLIDEPVCEQGCKDKHQLDLKSSNGVWNFSEFQDSAKANFNKSDRDLLPYPKRTKLENSCLVAPLKNHTCSSKPPPSIDDEAMEKEFRESFTKSTQYSVSLGKIRRNDAHDYIRKTSEPAMTREPMDIELTSGNNTRVNVKEISDILPFKSSPKELGVDCVASETQMRAMSIQTQSELKAEHEKEENTGKPSIKAHTIIEDLTTEQIKEHIKYLRQWTDQDFLDKNIQEIDKNACTLCGKCCILLAPKTIYCSSCSVPVKRNANYYYSTRKENSPQYYFCTKCHKLSQGREIFVHGICILKETLHRGKNDSEFEESWVQCDKCESWQHQTCGLFDGKINSGANIEYKCPKCWLKEKESRDYKLSTKNVVFSAKDLPRTKFSDHIEERLFRRLKQERKERAKVAGKCFNEVAGAEDLTVRVVLSMREKMIVKKQLLDILEDESYPTEFPYTSKLILLFQKIGGVDVCLFSMYVQEFGSECGKPNQRCVYISYLDSIKYFRPVIGTSTGEALRTFAFHEILLGYLDHVKKRGFATCYIWACPPIKGDDFFFYCHPETQKIPKSDKLRQWYHSMLKKAENEEIVVNHTNLYDHFFIQHKQAKCKITAARLPYFDGDYWSGAVEYVIKDIEKESKKKTKKEMAKATLKSMGQTNSSSALNDILLMQKLGQNILPFKKDFIVIHLQFVCTHCYEPILSGKRWFCNQCKEFNLCERCHVVEQDLHSNETHTSAKGEQHFLSQALTDVTLDTKDEDVILDSELYENRNKFLSFCRDNHYQFDSLRRAKHSSMMMLYHLRHLIPPTVETGSCHIHKSTQQSSAVSLEEGSEVELSESLIKKLLRLMEHAKRCRGTKEEPCASKHCYNLRRMFTHAKMCTVRVNGGCTICKKVWYALNLHSKSCTEQDCLTPRCKDLKRFSALRC